MLRKKILLATLILCVLAAKSSFAQMLGDCDFLRGRSVEIGIAPNGAYGGTVLPPAGYHANGSYSLYDPGSGVTTFGALLGFVADPAQDGWTVGTPPMYGDYFVPGTPQEGWSIQVNGVQSDAWLQNLQFTGSGYTGSLSGTTLSFNSSGNIRTGVWRGQTTNPLQITQTTRLDTTKLYFTVNVKIVNNGAAPANNVYYMRTLDPDNEEQQTGSFTTINNIAYQLPNAQNKVMVTATGTTYSASFLGLGTKDCRAKCFIIDFGLSPFYSLDALYNQATTYYYAPGYTSTSDQGVGLVYNLGNIAAGDSVDLTYAYVLRAADIDSALSATSPALLANSTLLLPGSDTINACTGAIDTLPVVISSGASYTWTWAPAWGLSSTTGTSSTLILSTVPSITTYTVIGVPISGALCGNDTFHFTVIPGISSGPGVTDLYYCQNAVAPALTAIGTSLLWYTAPTGGTGSATAPTPSTAVPGVFTWWVSQHVGACGESIRVPINVSVTPQPYIDATSNSPVCQYSTLLLHAIDTITVGGTPTFSWAGPGGYSSTSQNPVYTGVPLTASGVYTVTINLNGCLASDTTRVVIKPTPTITFTSQTTPSACNVSDGTITINGLTADSAYYLFYTFNGYPMGGALDTANGLGQIVMSGLHAGIYSNIFVTAVNGCSSNAVVVTLPDGAAPPPPTLSSNGPICADSVLMLFATDTTAGIVYHWSGPLGFSSTLQNPIITNASAGASGNYLCTITKVSTGCVSAASSLAVTVKPTPTIPAFTGNSPVCEGTALNINATSSPAGASFSWTGPNSFSSGLASITINPVALVNGGTYSVVATLNGCPSNPGYYTAVVHPIPPAPVPNDVAYCQYDLATPLTATGVGLLWYTSATGGVGSATAPTPSTQFAGTYTTYVSQTILGCESPRAPLVATIKVKPVVTVTPRIGSVCQSDTLSFYSTGPLYTGATYLWQLPVGASFASGSDSILGPVVVQFDSSLIREVMLTISLYGCTTTGVRDVYVVPTPTLNLYVNPNVCLGDTVTVALSTTTYHPVISSYVWDFGGGTIITASSGSGGPYSITWGTAGAHVVHVTGYTEQSSCPSQSMYDTINVHANPDATFTGAGVSCAGDTVVLVANTSNPSYSYLWTPAPFFPGAVNLPTATATVMFPGYITLTVTDPFGCHGSDSLMFSPAPCCLVTFPTGFTPNGDGSNDYFRPVTAGHHTLSMFRVVNRWGTTVFETTSTDTQGWDGKYGGVPQDMDTYYYHIKYTCNGTTYESSGDVVLVR